MSIHCSSCCHSSSGRRLATGSAAFSAVLSQRCFPSRSRAPFRSSPGNYGRPPRGRDRPTANRPPKSHLPFAIALINDKRVTSSCPVARLSGGLVGEQQFAARQSERQAMKTTESSPGNKDGARERDHALE